MKRALLLSSFLAACKGSSEGPPPTGAAATAAAQTMFADRCASCHGLSGKGDGPAASALNPKPRDYTDKAWQAAVSDEQLRKIIVGGGLSVGKSAQMPASPDLQNKPEVTENLVSIIRAFGRP